MRAIHILVQRLGKAFHVNEGFTSYTSFSDGNLLISLSFSATLCELLMAPLNKQKIYKTFYEVSK
jgi:hypothetical protein